MKKLFRSFEQFPITIYLIRWTLLILPVSLVAGSLVAVFLWLLDKAIHIRWDYPWLLYGLPLAGVAIYWLYRLAGKNSEAGNNLIMNEIHEPGGGVPARMAPLVLATTVITHLFGGSAGREGTAVQIGGSIAQFFARRLRLSAEDTRLLLTTGIAAGFGAVFGTPVTGAIFAMEVLAIGRIQYNALVPCLIAAVLADVVCASWGIHHTAYAIHFVEKANTLVPFVHFDFLLLAQVIGLGILSGLAGSGFAHLTDGIKHYSKKWIKPDWLIPAAGGVVIIGLTFIVGTQDYLSLGVTGKDIHSVSIIACFGAGGASYFSWFWKLLFTAITLGTGFKGGEVTPLFFVGAALGNALGTLTGAPIDLMAGLGFIAVFAGATNTPVACTIMGVELFGPAPVLYYAVACFTAYYFSGHSGIYSAQRIAIPKIGRGLFDK